MTHLMDTHFHFDFIKEEHLRQQILTEMEQASLEVVAQTVLPSEYERLIKQNIKPHRVSLGFHPWWIENQKTAESELVVFEKWASRTRLIGEIGLDFSDKRLAVASQTLQISIFKQLIQQVVSQSQNSQEPYILSIHAVRSVTEVLDVLEACHVMKENIIPIIHWFSGSSDELTRLIKMGCYLSINPRMLTTKKGRTYVTQVPRERLLLETDWPSHKITLESDLLTLISALKITLPQMVEKLSALRDEEMLEVIVKNQQKVYGANTKWIK
ncbi:TatD family hydrolase [Globicatella sulfidifaciens]